MAVSKIAGNVAAWGVFQISFDAATVTALTTSEQTFNAPGVRLGDFIFVNQPPAGTPFPAGLAFVGARVSADNTLALRIGAYPTGGNNAPLGDYQIFAVRPESGVSVDFNH